MRTLVTGATSGLGRNAAAFLASRGTPVRLTGRNRHVGDALAAQGYDFVPADLSTASKSEIDRLLADVDTVWHCAALSSPWGKFADFHAANVAATAALARAAARRGVRRFIHISTPSLYFDYRHRLGVQETFRPRRFVNHYARTKALAEEAILEIAARHPDTTFALLRPRGIFGPHDRVLLPRILRLLRERGGRLPLPRGGGALLDLTYVDNVVHAMQLATTVEGYESGEAFNVTNGEPTTLRSMLEALLSRLGVRYAIASLPYPLLDAAARAMQAWSVHSGREPALTRYSVAALHFDMTLDIDKASRMLGYRPVVSLAQGIESTVHWVRSHGDDYGL